MICEEGRELRKHTYCADDEWCIGPTNSTNSIYRVDSLCVKVNVSCRPDMRAPGCGFCPKIQDEADCDINQGCNRDFNTANNWCIGDDCYLDPLDGSCKENVCVSIKMVPMYDANDLHWTLGACSPSLQYKNGMVQKEKDCCLAPGNHTLTCYNRREPHGWKKGFIVINGERYCDDFIGYKAMRRIVIKDSNNDQFDERIHTSFNITHASSISSWSTYEAGMKGCTGEGLGLLGNFRQYLALEECKRSCDGTAYCNSIAWNSRDNRCYLKNKLDICDDSSCAWDRNDAMDWGFYWKTCGKCIYSPFYTQNKII